MDWKIFVSMVLGSLGIILFISFWLAVGKWQIAIKHDVTYRIVAVVSFCWMSFWYNPIVLIYGWLNA